MFCIKCGYELNDEMLYCPKCGAKNELMFEKIADETLMSKNEVEELYDITELESTFSCEDGKNNFEGEVGSESEALSVTELRENGSLLSQEAVGAERETVLKTSETEEPIKPVKRYTMKQMKAFKIIFKVLFASLGVLSLICAIIFPPALIITALSFFAMFKYNPKNPELKKSPVSQSPEPPVTFRKLPLEDDVVRCPKCRSTSLSANKKGFGVGKAVVGGMVAGPIGLVAGNINAKKIRITCLKCGHTFWAGKR